MKFATCLAALFLIPAMVQAQEEAADKAEMNQKKLDELLDDVQDMIELDPTLRGVMITGGKFVPKMGMPGEELQLQGKLSDLGAQGPKIKAMVEKALGDDPYWREGEGPLTVTVDTMKMSEGSRQVASLYTSQGLEQFWDEEYKAADRAFARALAEAPNDEALPYWRVLSALAQDQEDRAKKKLEPLLAQNPLGSRASTVAASLERVQGPLRMKLMKLEQELLAEM